MGIDLAIEYKAKLMEIKDNLNQLREINIEVNKYDEPIQEIINRISLEVEQAYKNLDKATSSTFLSDTLNSIYQKGIDELNLINKHIVSQFETYYQIFTKLSSLKAKLSSVNSNNINEFVEESELLLQKLISSSTVDYDSEKKVVDEVYDFIYKAIKLELVYTDNSSLLDSVKNDSINSIYISTLIKNEIDSLKRTEETSKIFLKLNELKSSGFNSSNIVDKELLILLISIDNKDIIKDIRENYLIQFKEYDVLNSNLQRIISCNNDSLIEIKKAKKTLRVCRPQRNRNKIIVFVDLGIIGLSMILAVKLAKIAATDKQYKTTTVVYDSSSDEESISEDYYLSMDDKVSLLEYSPWTSPGYFRDIYSRCVYTYDLSNLGVSYENLSDYLNEDLKGQIILSSSKIESSKDIPDDINYTSNKYVITSIIQDKKIYKKVFDESEYNGSTLPIAVILAVLADLMSCCISTAFGFGENRINNLNSKISNAKNVLENNKKFLMDNKGKAEELYNNLKQVKKRLLDDYQSLSSILQNDEQIKQKVLKLKDDNQDKLK